MPLNNWIGKYLASALSRRLCTKVCCTTCGAREFRVGLTAAAAHQLDGCLRPSGDAATANVVARALAEIAPDFDDPRYSKYDFEAAVRLVLSDIWNTLGHAKANETIAPLLSHSWAGDLLERMKAHYATLMEQQKDREAYENPQHVVERRSTKRRLRQERHAARIAAKRQRDQARDLGGESR